MRAPARAGCEKSPSTRTDENALKRVAFFGFIFLFFYQSIIGAQTAPPGTQIVNAATVTAQTTGGPVTRTSNAVSTTVAAVPFSLVKAVSPSGSVGPGETLTYTLGFTNTYGSDQTGVVLLDMLDPAFTGATAMTNGTIPDLGGTGGSVTVTGSYDPFTREVRFTIPLLPAGFIGEVSFQATISATTPSDTLVLNRFSASSDQDPAGVTSADVGVGVVGPALGLDLVSTRGQVEVGDLTGFVLRVTNRDPAIALSGARVRFRMPKGLRYREGSFHIDGRSAPDPSPGSGGMLILPIGGLPAGETVEATLAAIVTAGAERGERQAVARASARTPSGLPVRAGPVTAVLKVVRGVLAMEAVIAGRVFADLDGDGQPTAGEPAVPGVRLVLEDGTQVITDVAGKYHIEGIRPGLHVLKLDEETLPPGMTPAPGWLRSHGSPGIQFIDLNASELFKANFPLTGDRRAFGGLLFRLEPEEPEAEAGTPLLSDKEPRRSEIPPVLASALFEPGSSVLKPGTEQSLDALATLLLERGAGARRFSVEPTGRDETVLSRSRALALESAVRRLMRVNRERPERPGPGGGARPRNPAEPIKPPSGDPSAERLKRLEQGLYVLEPGDGEATQSERIQVEVAFPTGESLRLSVGGSEISEDRIGTRMETSLSGMTLYRYVGVALEEGDNSVVAESSGGDQPRRVEIHVSRRGAPGSISIRGEAESQPADGKTPARAVIEVRDARGLPVPDGTMVTVDTEAGQILGTDLDTVSEGFQVRTSGGKAIVRLSPAQISEARKVTARSGKAEGEGEVLYGTHLRDWIVTGVGEAGWSRHSEESEDDLLADLMEPDGLSARLAVYAKGKLGEKDMLTVSYDTRRERDEDSLFRVQDPSRNFPVYGDSSLQSYDLQSQGKLALRWERERSMAMVGDFRTGLTGNELARYDRVLTGGFAHIEQPGLTIQAFGASTPQSTVRDALPADGSSGPYRLSRRPIVAYSERVILEVRDRYHTEKILESRDQARYADYDIDYVSGTILFRSPVEAEDLGFNPVTIVVTYELVDPDGSNLVAGGRLSHSPNARFSWGTTAVQEERGDADLWVTGADVTVRPWTGASITGEYARTDTDGEATGAVAVKFSSALGERTSLAGYYRDVPATYANPSMTGVGELGSHKEGLEVRTSLPDGSRLLGEASRQEQEVLGLERDTVSLDWQKPDGPLTWEAGGRALNGTTEATGDDGSSFLIRTGLRARVGSRFDASIFRQEVLSGETVTGFPTRTELGAGYKLNEHARAFLRHEIDQGDIQTSQRNHLGIEGQLNEYTTIESRYALENAVNARRGYALVGVRTRVPLNELWTADFRTERAETVVGQPGSDFTSISAGAEYTPGKVLFSNRYEVRFGEQETRHLLSASGALKLTPDLIFFARNRLNLSQPDAGEDQLDADGLIGIAYRPLDHDKLNWLGRMEAVRGERLPGGGSAAAAAPSARGLMGVFELNYQPIRRLHLLGRYAGRYARDRFQGARLRSYTEVWEGRVMVDAAKRVTAGIAGRLLRQPSSSTSMTGLGLEAGLMVAPDLWVVGGYNVTGFNDDLFPDGERRSRGPFLSLRFKFDEGLIRKLSRSREKEAGDASTAESP